MLRPGKITMDYLTIYLEAYIKSDASMFWNSLGWSMDPDTFNPQSMKYAVDTSHISKDNITAFNEPTADIINDFNNMLFRAAALSSTWSNLSSLMDPGLSPYRSTLANQTVTRNVFQSDFRWYAAATALEVLVVMVVLPMFWGWWTLRSDLDLSPFGLGVALNAPL